MSDSSPTTESACPACGAGLRYGTTHCWLCGAELPAWVSAHSAPVVQTSTEPVKSVPADAVSITPLSDAPTEPVPIRRSQFTLATLLMVMTLTAVWLGLTVAAPGLGILAAIVLAPALVRCAAQVSRAREQGYRPDATDRIAFFMISIGLVMLIGLAAIISFFVICFAGVVVLPNTGPQPMYWAFFALLAIAPLSLAGWIFWWFWPRAKR